MSIRLETRPARLELPRRLLAGVAAAGLLVIGIAPGVDARQSGLTFTAQPGTSTILAAQAVTAADRSATVGKASPEQAITDDRLPDLAPKEPRTAASSARAKAPALSTPQMSAGRNQPPGPVESFIGQQGSNVTCSYFAKGCNPPDMAIAASPTRVLQGVNTQWEVLSPSGAVLPGWPRSAQSFFGVPSNTCDPGSGGQPFLSDPRALYDPSTGRFWAAMLQVEGAVGVALSCPVKTVYYIAVSQTDDPSGSWNVYAFDMSLGTTNVADFTQIGLDNDALYFSANIFNQAGTAYEYAEIFEANKHQMETGRTSFTADGFFNLQVHGPGGDFLADTVQPALAVDGHGAGTFVDTLDGPDPISGSLCSSPTDTCRGLAVWRMGNPTAHDDGGPAPTLTGARVDTQPFIFSPPADEPGCTQCVDASDLRIGATPMERNGTISVAWETGSGPGGLVPGIEWAQFKVAGPAPSGAHSGYYTSPMGAGVSYPALVPGPGGGLTMIFDRMSSSINPETRYVMKGGGASQFSGDGRLLKAGEAAYRPGLCGTAIPVCRWGDYSAASFDGQARIWIAGQYANSFTDPTVSPEFGRNWGTWMASLAAHR
ncbi:MAG: hypothetical protein ACHQXL_00050 [Candidatus Limnocylindrales bacterium]